MISIGNKLYFGMSKTPEDYRNIVKILKLKLIKLREQNSQLASRIGDVDENAHSSYKDRITHFKTQQSTIANNCLLFLSLADRCELFGLTPEMVFRIADHQRTKKVAVQIFSDTLKRLALKLDEGSIVRLCTFLNTKKDGFIYYDDYMALINAYQVQREKYPLEGRSFTQEALTKFGGLLEGESSEVVFDNMVGKAKGSSATFEQFLSYAQTNLSKMKENELIAVFMTLASDDQVQIKRSQFNSELSRHQHSFSGNPRQDEAPYDKKISVKGSEVSPSKPSDKSRDPNKAQVPKSSVKAKDENDDFQESEMTADQGKKKVVAKQASSDIKEALNILRANGLTVENLLTRALDSAEQKKETKSIGFPHLFESATTISQKVKRGELLNVFKVMDCEKKGSLCSFSMIRFWLEAKNRNDGISVLLRLMKREITMKSCSDALEYFTATNVKLSSPFAEDQFKKAFPGFKLKKEELQELGSLLSIFKGTELAKKINEVGKSVEESFKDDFKKLDPSKVEVFSNLIKTLVPKEDCKLQRHNRGLQKKEFWNTIFNNEWACWNFCLQTSKSLNSSWRDPDFGPIDADKNGFNSIIANANDRVDWRLPEEEYTWINHQELLRQNESPGKVNFFNEDISTNNVVQGAIGNCWFVSALSIISQYPTLLKGEELAQINLSNIEDCLKGVVPTLFAGFRRFGIYVFKFFKDGNPLFVVVDDRIPSRNQSRELLFARTPTEKLGVQWVSLVEKAYAKLHNTYSALFSGDIAEGLRDLTNCLSVRQIVPADNEEKEKMWEMLSDFKHRKTLMGCSIATPVKMAVEGAAKLNGELTGLFYGHAYSISDVFSLDNNKATDDSEKLFTLMRLRNPWGHGEYTLDWGQKNNKGSKDYDPEDDKLFVYKDLIDAYYKQEQINAKTRREEGVEVYTEVEDGIFLMSFQDWSQIYTSIFLGINLPPEWGCQSTLDAWSPKYPSMTISLSKATEEQKKEFANKNLQYRMQLKEETEILCILQQKDGRLYRGQIYPYKGIWNPTVIMAFKISNKDSKLEVFDKKSMITDSLKLEARREITLMRKFPKGTYILMPITKVFQDGVFEDKFPDFEMQIYYKCDKSAIKLSRGHDGKAFQNKDRKTLCLSPGSDTKVALALVQKIKQIGI